MMQQYMLSVYQPEGAPPPDIDMAKVGREVGAWRDEVRAAGVLVFEAKLHPASSATAVQVTGGEALVTDGPYIEGKEHIAGFTILRAPDLDAALEWARKVSRALAPLPIEVRPVADTGG